MGRCRDSAGIPDMEHLETMCSCLGSRASMSKSTFQNKPWDDDDDDVEEEEPMGCDHLAMAFCLAVWYLSSLAEGPLSVVADRFLVEAVVVVALVKSLAAIEEDDDDDDSDAGTFFFLVFPAGLVTTDAASSPSWGGQMMRAQCLPTPTNAMASWYVVTGVLDAAKLLIALDKVRS